MVVILIVSLFFIIRYASKPPPTSTPIPTSTPTPTSAKTSPAPTGSTSPVPTVQPTPTSSQTSAPTPEPTPVALYLGEVTQYEGQNLTAINAFIEDIVQHPDVAIDGTQDISRATYLLNVTGLVSNPLLLTYNDVVNNFQPYQQVATLHCVEGWSVTMLGKASA